MPTPFGHVATAQFNCPSCGYAYTKVENTSKSNNNDGLTRRRRKCLKCQFGFITYEVFAADYLFLQATRKWLKSQQTQTEAQNGELPGSSELRSSSNDGTVPNKETPA